MLWHVYLLPVRRLRSSSCLCGVATRRLLAPLHDEDFHIDPDGLKVKPVRPTLVMLVLNRVSEKKGNRRM